MRWAMVMMLGALTCTACAADGPDTAPTLPPPSVWSDEAGCAESTWTTLHEAWQAVRDLETPRSNETRRAELDTWYDALRTLAAGGRFDAPMTQSLTDVAQDFMAADLDTWSADGGLDRDRTGEAGRAITAWMPFVQDVYFDTCTEPAVGFTETPIVVDLDVPPGSLLTWDLREGGLWRLDLASGADRPFSWPVSDATPGVLSPDGSALASTWPDRMEIRDATGAELARIELTHAGGCVTWSGDDRVIVTMGADEAERSIVAVDLDTAETETLLKAGPWDCAVELSEGRLAVTDIGDDAAAVLLMVDGAVQTRLADDSCNLIVDKVLRDGSFTLTAACHDARRSGLLRWDLEENRLETLITGRVGVNSWSPDGRFLAFAYFPQPGFAVDAVVYLFDGERGAIEPMTTRGRSFPTLLPD